jgi:ABC-type multidrug transport system ATPase subunit
MDSNAPLQDDRMYAHLTVFETLMYSAHFYLPNDVTDEQKAELVTNVISELGLGKVRDTYIGDEKIRGVSGGERKRANIGVQLISDPAVLFLDEPTSGLDSFQAQAVIDSMRAIAHRGRLVITVIHQPRYSMLYITETASAVEIKALHLRACPLRFLTT